METGAAIGGWLIFIILIFMVILFVLWVILPFYVIGISNRLDKILAELQKQNGNHYQPSSHATTATSLPRQQKTTPDLTAVRKTRDGRYEIG